MLAAAGADLVIACRNAARSGPGLHAARSEQDPAPWPPWTLDLARLASVREAADTEIREALPGAARAGQQRWHHADPADSHRGRPRAAARHQPPGPLPADRAAVRSSSTPRTGGSSWWRASRTSSVACASTISCSRRATRPSGPTVAANSPTCCSRWSCSGRLIAAAGSGIACIACHPGYSATNLQLTGPTAAWRPFYRLGNGLYRAEQPRRRRAHGARRSRPGSACAGGYYGPTGLARDCAVPSGDATLEPRGARPRRRDAASGRLSEALVDFTWPWPPPDPGDLVRAPGKG
jgi:NAD(P)-dependent dehydrogenase (short-subunit alcohol dehydrogenase family)